MKKLKYILPIFLVLSVLILVGVFFIFLKDSNQLKEEIKADPYENYEKYSNNDWRFEIQYPKNWKNEIVGEDANSFVIVFLSQLEDKLDMSTENVLVFVSVPETNDFKETMTAGITKMSENPTISLIGNREIMVSGYPAYELIYISESDISFKYLHYFVDAGDRWYQILYTSEEGQYEKTLETVKTIINSFKIF